MTKEELELLKVKLSPLNLNTPTPLITEFGFKNNKEDVFCIKIGKASPNSALSALRGGLGRIKVKETEYNQLKSKYDEDLKRTQK